MTTGTIIFLDVQTITPKINKTARNDESVRKGIYLTLQFRNAYPSKLGSTTLVSFYCGRFVNHEYKAWSDSEDKNVVSYGELIEHESN